MLRQAQRWRSIANAAAYFRFLHFPPGRDALFSTTTTSNFDTSIERHYIVHDLAFPMRPPAKNEQLEAAAASIWADGRKHLFTPTTGFFKAIVAWRNKGNNVTKELINALLIKLCARGQYVASSWVMSWVLKEAPYQITDEDRLLSLRMWAMHGDSKFAKAVFDNMYEKTEEAYRELLKSHSKRKQQVPAMATFNDMKNAKLITTSEPYEHMIAMYLRLRDLPAAMNMISELEKSGFPPSAFMYRLLVDFKVDVKGLEGKIKRFLDRVGNTKLKGAEWRNCIILNATLGRKQAVQKLWEDMKHEGVLQDRYFLSAAEAFGKIDDMSSFNEVCAQLVALHNGKLLDNHCSLMLKVYTEKGLMEEAEKLVKKAYVAGFRCYDYLVAGYMKQRNPTKALEMIHESFGRLATRDRPRQYHLPSYGTLLLAMQAYAETKDVEGAEKLMDKICENNRGLDARVYNGLLKVYIAANMPVSGIEERMKSKNVPPDAETNALLDQF